MPSFRDLTGQRFGRWTVLKHVGKKYAEQFWWCECDCGTEKAVVGSSLKMGRSTSCGCYSKERSKTHGMDGTPTYNTWAHMLSRCRHEGHKQYKDYGGRGITVCDEWLKFENFYADMGEKPEGMSLDRVNNDGPYNKENCRWATQRHQVRNRRVSPKYNYNGKDQSLAEICDRAGLPWRRVYERIRAGWDLKRAIETPIRKKAK